MTCESFWGYISLIIALIAVSSSMILILRGKHKVAWAVMFLTTIGWFIYSEFVAKENISELHCKIGKNIGAMIGLEIKADQEIPNPEVIDVKYSVVDVKYTADRYEMCYYKDKTNVVCDQINKNEVLIRESASREKYFVGKCEVKDVNLFLYCTEAFIYLPKEDIKKLLILR
jgi:hypothetical protein